MKDNFESFGTMLKNEKMEGDLINLKESISRIETAEMDIKKAIDEA